MMPLCHDLHIIPEVSIILSMVIITCYSYSGKSDREELCLDEVK